MIMLALDLGSQDESKSIEGLFCPFFNPVKIAQIIHKCDNVDAAILALHLKFRHRANNRSSITRSEIAGLYGWGLRHTDSVIADLKKTGIVKVTLTTVNKKSKLYFSFDDKNDTLPLHIVSFHKIANEIGFREAVLFSYILYRQRNSQIIHHDKKWAAITRDEIATFLNLSTRTVSRLIDSLKNQGLIEMENMIFNDQIQQHFNIPQSAHDLLSPLINQFMTNPPPKKEESLTKKAEETAEVIHRTPCQNEMGDIAKPQAYIVKNKEKNNIINLTNFNQQKFTYRDIRKIEKDLTTQQDKYLTIALSKLLAEKNKSHLERDFFEQIKFCILNPAQHKGINDFLWVTNRSLKLIRENKWKTPFGFKKYSDYGKKQNDHKITYIEKHLALKQAELAKSGRTLDKYYLDNC
jgi:DNA-binding Lrp family transcriptional regulator